MIDTLSSTSRRFLPKFRKLRPRRAAVPAIELGNQHHGERASRGSSTRLTGEAARRAFAERFEVAAARRSASRA